MNPGRISLVPLQLNSRQAWAMLWAPAPVCTWCAVAAPPILNSAMWIRKKVRNSQCCILKKVSVATHTGLKIPSWTMGIKTLGMFSFPTMCATYRIPHCIPVTAYKRIFRTIQSIPITVAFILQDRRDHKYITCYCCKVQCQHQNVRALEDSSHTSELCLHQRESYFY